MSTAARSPAHFKREVHDALQRPNLKVGLDRTIGLLQTRRLDVLAKYPNFEETRELGARIKDHTLQHLDHYLAEFEKNATAAGAVVHWAETPAEVCQIVIDLCRKADAKSVTRVKSMLGEEIGLPKALADAGIERVETDLAEHIIQLADEPPSHIVIPAMHKTREEVADLFKEHHKEPKISEDVGVLVESARQELRPKYVGADVGISGANFLIASTGSVCTVTNEGNAELTTELPRMHIVTAGIEKVVPTPDDALVLLRLLARSALGIEFTQYTSFFTGPRRADETRGPEEMHIVLVDNNRTQMLASEMKPMLRCIRCAACINHCPVYSVIGGHPYGATYPGPMGTVLAPAMHTLEVSKDLPHACTLNGRCAEVCPVKIPLPDLIRSLRDDTWRRKLVPKPARLAVKLWAKVAARPWLYQTLARCGVRALRSFAGKSAMIDRLPLAGGWTGTRDFPAPSGKTFMEQYKQQQKRGQR
jgi:L-lactate dehydrogenase complex protein LldF